MASYFITYSGVSTGHAAILIAIISKKTSSTRCRKKIANTIMVCLEEWVTNYLFWIIYRTFQEIYCFISNLFLPFLHISPVHPAWHPPIQWPVTLSHLTESLQVMLQFSTQLYPYCPSEHAIKDKYTCLIRKEVMLKGILYFNEIEKVVCQLNMCFFLNKRLRLFKALHMLRNVVLIIRSVRNSTRIWHVFQH